MGRTGRRRGWCAPEKGVKPTSQSSGFRHDDKFEDGFLDAVDKIKELMETGEFRDPIAERQAQENDASQDSGESEPQAESSAASEDDIAFDDL